MVRAVRRGEATYDGVAAAVLAQEVKDTDCLDFGAESVFDDLLPEVFTPLLEPGDVCHSDVACPPEHECVDVSVVQPRGICEPRAIVEDPTTELCGNGIVDQGEQCDGSGLQGLTCATLGVGTGTLGCSNRCTYDISLCSPGP